MMSRWDSPSIQIAIIIYWFKSYLFTIKVYLSGNFRIASIKSFPILYSTFYGAKYITTYKRKRKPQGLSFTQVYYQ